MKLLFIASEKTQSLILTMALRQPDGVAIQRCHALQEAQQILAQQGMDAIILLEPLPDGSAVDLWHFLRQQKLRVPLIVADAQDPEHATLVVPTFAKTAIPGLPTFGDETPLLFTPRDMAMAESLRGLLEQAAIPLSPESRPALQAQLLQSILDIAPLLLTEFELHALLQRIEEAAVRLIPNAQAGSLLMLEDGRFVHRGIVGHSEALQAVRLPGDHYLVPALQRGEIIHIRQPQQTMSNHFSAELISQLQENSRLAEVVETVAAPLMMKGELMGYLTVDTFTKGASFSTTDEEALRLFTSLAAIGVHNARLFQAERDARALAETLQKIGTALVTALDENEIIQIAAGQIRQILPFQCMSISLLQEASFVITPYSQGLPADIVRWLQGRLPLSTFHTWVRMYQTGRGLVISDTNQDPRWVKLGDDLRQNSFIGVPLRAQGKVIGFLTLSMDEIGFYQPAHLIALQSFADLIAVALNNAHLFWEVRQARIKAEAAVESLRRLDAMKSQFIQNVSHELRTPLSIAKGYVDLLLDQSFGFPVEPTLQQAVQAVQVQLNQVVSLVESITALEDLEMDRVNLRPQPILPVIQSAVQFLQQQTQQHHLQLTIDLPPYLPNVVLDAERLGLALMHILDNAAKFNREGGHIWLKATAESERVHIQIKDEGIGIPAEELERIFERFYQIDGSAHRRYGGMGVGLSIVKEVIERHGGRVWAESPGPDQGTTIHIVLPVYQEKGNSR